MLSRIIFSIIALVVLSIGSIIDFGSSAKASKEFNALALSNEFGVNDAASSLSSNSDKDTVINKMAEGGFGWSRYEFTYATDIDFSPFDAAQDRLDAKGIQVIGLLHFSGGNAPSLDDWKTFVNAVVSRYGSRIEAWEVMNEVDNHMSGRDYVSYLRASKEIIKSINSSAKVVASGITSRAEATDFWDGIAAGGGWGDFDVLGLHIYHSGNPEKVNFGGGDITAELDRVVANINKNGGGKKIWITETGYKYSEGAENQANWIARTLLMANSVSSVEKIIIYRLYETGQGYGILDQSFNERPVFDRIAEVISQISGRGTGSQLDPQDDTTIESFDSTSAWSTKGSNLATVNLGTTTGYTGSGMEIRYTFNDGKSYALAEKEIAIANNPAALAIRINGDNTKNVWKLRFKDAKGETFQMDLGAVSSGWKYKQFNIETDSAITSWDGDKKVDYPIKFNSVVVDRQSSPDTTGTGIVDDLVAIYGSADLFAYKYNDIVSYWKASGSATSYLCNGDKEFTETPKYITGVSSCPTTKPADPAPTPTPIPTPEPTPEPTPQPTSSPTPKPSTDTTTAPEVKVSAEKSQITTSSESVVADGEASIRITMLFKDSSDNIVTSKKPEFLLENFTDSTTISDPVLTGNEWIAEVVATTAGERGIQIKIDGERITTVYPKFTEPVQATEVIETVVQQPAEVAETPKKGLVLGQKVALALSGLILLILVLWWLIHYRRRVRS